MNVAKCCNFVTLFSRSRTDGYLHIQRNLRRARGSLYNTENHEKYVELIEKLHEREMQQENSLNMKKPQATSSDVEKVKIHTSIEKAIPSVEKDNLEVTKENQYRLLANRMTPLHHMEYEDQLKQKYHMCMKVMKEFGKNLIAEGITLPEESKNMPCVLDPIIPSPTIQSYRNKDEFSIRQGVDGHPKTVGFFLDSVSADSNVLCVGPDHLSIIQDSHKRLAQLFQSYIRTSPLSVCTHFQEGGHWRNLVVRSNKNGEIMAIAIVHPQQLSQEELQEEMCKFRDYVLQHKEDLNLKSLYFQACVHTKCTHKEAPFQLLYGEPYIYEELNGIKYRISPESFFQTNSAGAEVLYNVIRNACRPTKSTTVLDVCCGVGPVSFALAPRVKQCIGVDASVEAIKDARFNAKLNGIENVQFHVGRCEYVLPDILNEIYSNELVAIVNPGRSALSPSAIDVLRASRHLKKILFVTCKPSAAIPNLVKLCAPPKKNRNLGAAFHPMRAVPVDLFPQTTHFELVILFQRICK